MMMTYILFKEYPEGFMKEKRCLKGPCGQDGLSGVFPQSLDDVEIRGIRWEENQVYSKLRGLFLYSPAVLVPGIVKNDGHRNVSALIPHFFKKRLDLFGINIHHGMRLNEVHGKWINGSEQIEPVSSGSGRKIKRSLAPYPAGKGFKSEMHRIHKQQSSFAFIGFGYNRLNVSNPLLLPVRVGLSMGWLEFLETHFRIAHKCPYPCETECVSAKSSDYVGRFPGISGRTLYKRVGYVRPFAGETIGTTSFFFCEENVLQSIIVICMNHIVYEIAASACEVGDRLAPGPGISHLGQKHSASFSYGCAGIAAVHHPLEGRHDIFRIFDG